MASRPKEDLRCPVCHDIFKNPVILSCSHTFCKACWHQWWTQGSNHRCPLCNTPSQQFDPPCNLALKNLCEALLRETQEKRPAVFCSLHSEELKLFCEDHQQPVCVICLHSSLHNNHRFSPIAEIAPVYREDLREHVKPLQAKLDVFNDIKGNFDQTAKDIEVQAKDAERQINAEFSMLQKLLQEEQKARILALMEEKKNKSLVMKRRSEDLSRDIAALSKTVRATEEVLNTENLSFLQNYKTAAEVVNGVKWKDPQPINGGLIDTTKHLDNLPYAVLDKMKKAIQNSRTNPEPILRLPRMERSFGNNNAIKIELKSRLYTPAYEYLDGILRE
ncbi:E3 ubiquitin-protein ligase TRIM35-like [Eleginops maclovinus]|uniref:E3 ubiquitin-protein ligase TRIM35-like n=1 Tax=Eleginops maclovinus TaxID=56733 RepID=UPI003080176F